MKISDFFRDKIAVILIHIVCALLLFIYLSAVGLGQYEIILILIFWLLILSGFGFVQYWLAKRRITNSIKIMEALDQKYLYPETVESPNTTEHRHYFWLLKKAMTSMTEQVFAVRKEKNDYQEYIEQWAHEVKIPLTAIILTCESNLNDSTRKILTQTQQMEDYLDQVLYYARLDNVEKNYMIREVSLDDLISEALSRNKQVLIQNNFQISTNHLIYSVFTDPKWMLFMIGQVISNSVRYKKEHPTIVISGTETDNSVWLEITDSGIGIKESEIDRVFQKGFTGSNGRSYKKLHWYWAILVQEPVWQAWH